MVNFVDSHSTCCSAETLVMVTWNGTATVAMRSLNASSLPGDHVSGIEATWTQTSHHSGHRLASVISAHMRSASVITTIVEAIVNRFKAIPLSVGTLGEDVRNGLEVPVESEFTVGIFHQCVVHYGPEFFKLR